MKRSAKAKALDVKGRVQADAYIELMCRIEEEIRQEDSPPPPDDVDFDEYQEDGEDLEGSRSILCPDCRYFFLV